MITIKWLKSLVTEKIKTKKNHQIYKSTLINDKIHRSCHFSFCLIPNIIGVLIIYNLKILQYCPDGPPQITFGSNYACVVRRDRFYGY